MDEFKPNSHRYREEQKEASLARKKPEKIVNGKVRVKKKSELNKVKDVFISEDASNIGEYILLDVLIPAVKKAFVDIVTDGVNMLFYGSRGGSSKRSTTDRVSYRDYAANGRRDRDYENNRTRTGYNYDDITLDTSKEAEAVIDSMCDIIDTYGHATVADLYDLVGITGQYTDQKYGWKNLHNAEPIRVRDGYMLKLPKAIPINR